MLLSRDSVRNVLNSALLARDTDPSQFALWSLVLLATPPAMYAFRQLVNYSALGFQKTAIIERAIQVDRMFFLLYGMLVAALVAAAMWEALLPDRADQEIVGSLPVRPRTLAAARLAASVWIVVVASTAVNLLPAVFLAIAAPSHPALGLLPLVFVAHILATISASVFTFLTLLTARAVLALCFGGRTSERLATAMQLLTIAALAEVFFFIPGVIPALVERLAAGDRTALLIPSVPFAALYAWLVGLRYPFLSVEALAAPLLLVLSAAIVIPTYLCSARLFARRALDAQPHQHTGLVSTVARTTAVALPSSPMVRSILMFTVTTFLRSRRHRLMVTAYVGVALAVGTVSVIAGGLRGTIVFDRPETSLLAVPLVTMFFFTLGLRSAYTVPSDIDANWVFRLSQPRVMAADDATAVSMLLLSVIPIGVLGGAVAFLLGWNRHDAAVIPLIDIASGVVLIEWILRDYRAIPFTCARSGDVEGLKSRWLGQIIPLLLFAFVNAAIQKRVLLSDRVAVWYLSIALVACVIQRLRRRYATRHLIVVFDARPVDTLATLDLSDAIS
ncbi:MAG TPA: hypothetical protein VFU28_02715 [Vicinamibacterales bacterium]|nr:hypothetical protein [Vicinamibacterales bacterium]